MARGIHARVGNLGYLFLDESFTLIAQKRESTKGARSLWIGMEVNSAGHVAVYSSWCPKAIAAIGHLHPTLASRCIVIRMQRKTAREECERLKRLDATELKRKCARFVADNAEAIGRADPEMPKDLSNRAADVWEPLLVLADLAGGRWPKLARDAALGLTARAQDNSPIGSLLLDIYLAFIYAKVDRMFSRDLVRALSGYTDRP